MPIEGLKLKLNELKLKDGFEDLFDIAHDNALNLINIQEDKDFICSKRERSSGSDVYCGHHSHKGNESTRASKKATRTQRRLHKRSQTTSENEESEDSVPSVSYSTPSLYC